MRKADAGEKRIQGIMLLMGKVEAHAKWIRRLPMRRLKRGDENDKNVGRERRMEMREERRQKKMRQKRENNAVRSQQSLSSHGLVIYAYVFLAQAFFVSRCCT